MRILTAAWVVPVSSPPVSGGAIAVEADEIVAVGPSAEILARYGDRARRDDLGNAVLLPAFVNAHTHLELSWMRHAPPPRGDLMAWVRVMIDRVAPAPEVVQGEAREALAASREAGTALIGDVGNSTDAIGPLLASGLGGSFFYELIGGWEGGDFVARLDTAERDIADTRAAAPLDGVHPASSRGRSEPMRSARGGAAPRRRGGSRDGSSGASHAPLVASVVPHAAFSVAPELLRAIADRTRQRGSLVSVHCAETRAEVDLLTRGTGPFRAFMDARAGRSASWTPPGLTPVQMLDEAGLLGDRTLAVHAVHTTVEDMRLLRARDATVVLCPRSNAWIGVGTAPVERLLGEGVRLALGTDSHASNEDLDMLAELAALRRLAPSSPPGWAVHAATLGGARALGMDDRWGSLEPGKTAAMLALTRNPASRHDDSRLEPSTGDDPEPYATIHADRRAISVRVIE